MSTLAMTEIFTIQTPFAAFVAGLVTSLHCAVMCGPLACWLTPVRRDEDPTTIFALYQATRLLAYTALGGLAGGLGALPLSFLDARLGRYLPWALVLFFLITAFRLDRFARKPLLLTRIGFRLQLWSRARSKTVGAAVLGAATPLLPCGPLYGVATLAALTGSWIGGAEFLLAFGLGTLPLLWLTHTPLGWMRSRLQPATLQRLRSVVALLAAAVITWRLRGSLGFDAPSAGEWLCHGANLSLR